MNLIRLIKHYYSAIYLRYLYYSGINKLPIISSGITDDNFHFIKLLDNSIFYSYPSTKTQKLLYYILIKNKIKKVLKKECIRVAYDVCFRYISPLNNESHKAYDKGDTVIEVGAFIGLYTILAAKLVGTSGKVIAIEAIDENYQFLKKNIESNKLNNVSIEKIAAWHKEEKLKFYRKQRQRASAIEGIIDQRAEEIIPADTIDNIVYRHNLNQVDFVRIQVNGAELNVLKGMVETMKMRPKLSIAAIFKHKSHIDIEVFLKKNNYSFKYAGGSIYAIPSN